MALFSFRHSVKTFSEKRTVVSRAAKSGQTAAHLRYVTRPKAARVVMQERLAANTRGKSAILAEEEALKRKGRVCERFVIALPVEANPEQREALTRAYAEKLSQGIAGYVAAVHDQHGNDIRNPHAHLVFFDIQQKTGGRGRPKSILGLAQKNAIENAAKLWADTHNDMMRGWGFDQNSAISHKSYADRFIDRIPTIHEGASSRATSRTGKTNNEKWKHIDQGHTRAEANAIIREINQLKVEHNNARTLRLGTGDENDTAQRISGIAEQRKRGGGNVQAVETKQPPFKRTRQSGDGHRPVGDDPKAASSPLQSSTQPRTGQQPPFLAVAHFGIAHRLRRRRGVRRIYHELIMLRDSLSAWLSSKEEQRNLDPENPGMECQQHQLSKAARGHIGAAER